MTNNFIEEYYNNFKTGKNNICLTFYYNYKFNSANLIPNLPIPQSNPEKIILHLNYLLDFYIENKFKCNIKINDELWLTDVEYRDQIIDVFITKFKNSLYKPKKIEILSNVIHCLGKKQFWFIDLINKFNNIGIQVQLNFETILIDIVSVDYLFDIKDFLLKYTNKLKIKINPNNFVYFTEVFHSLQSNFNKILYLYEEDNVNWTDYKINEYVEFLDTYIDNMYIENNKDNIKFLQNLLFNNINLISLNNLKQNCCSFYQSLNILLEDLSVNLCPKFQYDDQVLGQYIYEKNKITNFIPKNINNIKLKENKNTECQICPFIIFCKGFCCKESYRCYLKPKCPIKESCNLKKVKYAFLLLKLKQLNIITIENFNQISNINLTQVKDIFELCNKIIQRI